MLTHDTWNIDTNWSSELFYDDKTKSLSCHVILEQCDWPKLFASFYLEVWDLQNKALIHKQGNQLLLFTSVHLSSVHL